MELIKNQKMSIFQMIYINYLENLIKKIYFNKRVESSMNVKYTKLMGLN